jgi:hypothetical protein
MATILGWTLEINHFFVSMFGNTLAFSKLPLKELLATQKEIMMKLNETTREIFQYACDLNAQQDYKWHKNLQARLTHPFLLSSLHLSYLVGPVLQASENEWKRMKYHLERATSVITRIENEHLDYNAQMKRLEDVATRFAPLMHRLDTNLPSIQQELGLAPAMGILPPSRAEAKCDKSRGSPLLLGNIPGDIFEDQAKGDPRVEEVSEGEEDDKKEAKEVLEAKKREPMTSEGDIVVSVEKKNQSIDPQTESQICEIS